MSFFRCCCGSSSSGACSTNLVPTTPTYYYFNCPNGGFTGTGNPGLAFAQGAPPWGSGVLLDVHPSGGFAGNTHVTFSNLAWYTPFNANIRGVGGLGSFQGGIVGGSICLYFQGCNGFLITVFKDNTGAWWIYDYDITWSFPLTHVAQTIGGITYQANTNSPFFIGQATTTQSGSGPALTGQFSGANGILSGGTGTSTFPAATIGAPTFSA